MGDVTRLASERRKAVDRALEAEEMKAPGPERMPWRDELRRDLTLGKRSLYLQDYIRKHGITEGVREAIADYEKQSGKEFRLPEHIPRKIEKRGYGPQYSMEDVETKSSHQEWLELQREFEAAGDEDDFNLPPNNSGKRVSLKKDELLMPEELRARDNSILRRRKEAAHKAWIDSIRRENAEAKSKDANTDPAAATLEK